MLCLDEHEKSFITSGPGLKDVFIKGCNIWMIFRDIFYFFLTPKAPRKQTTELVSSKNF